MATSNTLYSNILKGLFGVEALPKNGHFDLGGVQTSFFINYDEVILHRLLTCKDKDRAVELFFLERSSSYSLCKYVLKRKGKIDSTKVFPYSYKDLQGLCRDFRSNVHYDVLNFITELLNKEAPSSKKGSSKAESSKKASSEDKKSE